MLAVIEAAMENGDAAAVQAVVQYAKQAHPAAAADIDVLHRAHLAKLAGQKAQEEEQRRAKLAEADLLDGWSGKVEVGASRSTGTTSNFGLYGAVGLDRDGLSWRHKLAARAEVQETNSVRTAERISASWQPSKQWGEQAYGFGLAEYERDPFLGFEHRLTVAVGGGYSLLDRPGLSLEVEGGPALRHTESIHSFDGTSLGGRASADLDWKITPRLELKQQAALFLEDGTSTGRSTTALVSQLLGDFRVRLSHELRYERNEHRLVDRLDTTSRATVVYDF